MVKKYTLAEVKRKNKASGSDFFSRATMRFFGAAKYTTVQKGSTTYVKVVKSSGTVYYKFSPKSGSLNYYGKDL